MPSFEEIIATSYKSNHDGTWSSAPCAACGCTAFIFNDTTPECLACFMVLEDIEVKAEAFAKAMDAVGELVRVAEGSAKAELHTLAMLWRVTIARWIVATEPDRG